MEERIKTLTEIIKIEPKIEGALTLARDFVSNGDEEIPYFYSSVKPAFTELVGFGSDNRKIDGSDDYDTVYWSAIYLLGLPVVEGAKNIIKKGVEEWLEV